MNSLFGGDFDEEEIHAASTMAACVVTCFPAGDSVSCCNEARTSEHGPQRSTDSRLMGFKKDINSPRDNQARVG